MRRICENCGVSIVHLRSVAKFCSNACRAEYWRYGSSGEVEPDSKKELLTPKVKSYGIAHIDGLKGVLKDKAGLLPVLTRQPNPDYVIMNDKLKALEEQLKAKQVQLRGFIAQRKELENGNEGLLPVLGSIGGIFVDLPKTEKDENGRRAENGLLRIGAVALGLGGGFLVRKILRKRRLESLKEVKKRIEELNFVCETIKDEIDLFQGKLSIVDQFIEVEQNQEEHKNPDETPDFTQEIIEQDIPLELDGKIICSNDLKKMEFKSLDFQDEWEELFGKPAVSFHLVVHGSPGQGKSTFCLQFAHYLASHFGKVLYVSGEEGFSKTMKDKFLNNNAFSSNLYLADIHSFGELTESVAPNTYHFIFIDSLNNMGIDAACLKEMRNIYGNSGLITISQSTKKGNLRGSLEIEHEADISVKVENGFAFATKNRFKGLGYEFSIFG